jgi:aryl-alcohol dehydrogenase-like predicted oxidoreductase
MQYRTLGRTGVTVSRLCFGTMSFGGDADEATSAALFARCLDAGINFFDTANSYSRGHSEEILGKLIQGKRDELIISSKVCSPMGAGPNDRGLSRRHIMQQVENSLRRLQTDRLDLYFLHHFDPKTPVEEVLHTLDDLVRQGKILYPAVSNWAAWQIAKAVGISAHHGWARFECIQPMYSLVKRQVEVEILPLAESEQIGVISYSPLGGGLLTGKYLRNQAPTEGRFLTNQNYQDRYADELIQRTVSDFTDYAGAQGIAPATLAVAWTMAHPAITAPIIGARNVAQLEDSLAAADLTLNPEQYAALTALTYTPPPATDRSEEQRRKR